MTLRKRCNPRQPSLIETKWNQFLGILPRWQDSSRHGLRRKVCKTMSSKRGKGEGGDWQSPGARGDDEVGGEQSPDDPGEDKVIRLPRDWLGPREDLVPFGPSADRDRGPEPPSGPRDAPDDASGRPPLEEVAPLAPEPVSPDDFWGERSAALQGPLDEADRDVVVGDESG